MIRAYHHIVNENVADLYVAYSDKSVYMMSGSEETLEKWSMH